MYELALLVSALVFAGVTFAFVRSSAFSVFHPLTLYIVFHGFIFVIRPIIAYAMDFQFIYKAFEFTPSLSDKITVILASTLGFVVFAAACWRGGNRPMAFRSDAVTAAERARLTPLFFWVALLCVPIGAYSLSLIWSSAVSTGFAYDGMARDAASGISINTETNGYLVEAQLMLATCAAIFAWLFRFRLLAIAPLVLFVVFRAGTGGRGVFITALGVVGLLYLYERRRRFPTTLALFALPAIALLFAAVGSDRGEAIRRSLGSDTSAEVYSRYQSNARFLEGMDFANLEYFEYLVYVIPQRSGTYGYFNDVLQIFTEPVPRVLWQNKPVGAPFGRIHFFDYGRPLGFTRSLPGEGWYSLGWPGVVIWCGLCGWILGTIYRRYVDGPQSSLQTLAYMIFLATLIVAYRDGQLVTVFRQGLFFLAPVALWWLLARMVGIPGVAGVRQQFRRRAARRSVRHGIGPTAGREHSTPPAAVVRRRLALANPARAEPVTPD